MRHEFGPAIPVRRRESVISDARTSAMETIVQSDRSVLSELFMGTEHIGHVRCGPAVGQTPYE